MVVLGCVVVGVGCLALVWGVASWNDEIADARTRRKFRRIKREYRRSFVYQTEAGFRFYLLQSGPESGLVVDSINRELREKSWDSVGLFIAANQKAGLHRVGPVASPYLRRVSR